MCLFKHIMQHYKTQMDFTTSIFVHAMMLIVSFVSVPSYLLLYACAAIAASFAATFVQGTVHDQDDIYDEAVIICDEFTELLMKRTRPEDKPYMQAAILHRGWHDLVGDFEEIFMTDIHGAAWELDKWVTDLPSDNPLRPIWTKYMNLHVEIYKKLNTKVDLL